MESKVAKTRRFGRRRKKPKWWLLAAILLFHVAALYGLAKALVPEFTASIESQVASALTVTTVTPDPPPPPEAPPEPDEGAQGDPGKKAVADAVTAPETKIKRPAETPKPKASSTGSASQSGASQSGEGTGRAGSGEGTGSGNAGSGSGNGRFVATKPSVRSGNLNTARDFPIPEGGRESRFGKSVTVVFTVTTDGRSKNCSVARTSVDAQTTSLVCGLVAQKIRFNPAKDNTGQPVEARYGYRVDFRPR